jgi:hypothetical protein
MFEKLMGGWMRDISKLSLTQPSLVELGLRRSLAKSQISIAKVEPDILVSYFYQKMLSKENLKLLANP